jgi:hypothetical protein
VHVLRMTGVHDIFEIYTTAGPCFGVFTTIPHRSDDDKREVNNDETDISNLKKGRTSVYHEKRNATLILYLKWSPSSSSPTRTAPPYMLAVLGIL